MVKIWAKAKDPQWRQRMRHAYTIRFGQDLLYLVAVGALGSLWFFPHVFGGVFAELVSDSEGGGPFGNLVFVTTFCVLGLALSALTSRAWRWLRCRWSRQDEPDPPPRATHRSQHPWHIIRHHLSSRQTWLNLAGSLVASFVGLVTGLGTFLCFYFILHSPRILEHFLISGTLWWENTPLGSLLRMNTMLDPSFWLFRGYNLAIVQFVVVLAAILAMPWLLRFMAWAHFRVSKSVFTFDAANQKAEVRVSEVESSRASSRAAQSEALQRLERNIHDGPQQQLVRLGIDVTRARKHAESEPQAAVAILDECAERVQSVLTDLRDLSRGIAPPVLSDRGLVAAARELAAQSAIPTMVTAEIAAGTAVPYFAEETAYFVISEALANANKHSGATSTTVSVASDGDAAQQPSQLVVRVIDNGCGGAHQSKGRGLAGLVDRVAGAEGTLLIDSPQNGPTLVKATIPCVW